MKKFLFTAGLIAIFSFGVHAQTSDGSVLVTNDPLFWKTDLRLTKKQIAGIDSANATFYSSLKEQVAEDETQRKIDLSLLLQERSEAIWTLLSPRQKNRWRKIEAARYTAKGTRKFLHKFV